VLAPQSNDDVMNDNIARETDDGDDDGADNEDGLAVAENAIIDERGIDDESRRRKKSVKPVRYSFSQEGPYRERQDEEIRADNMISSATENKTEVSVA